jgi:hypothetical protein
MLQQLKKRISDWKSPKHYENETNQTVIML